MSSLFGRYNYHSSVGRANLSILVVQNLTVSCILWPFLAILSIFTACYIKITFLKKFFNDVYLLEKLIPCRVTVFLVTSTIEPETLFLTGKSWLRPNHTANSVTKLDVEITAFPGNKIVKGTIPKLKIIVTFVSGTSSQFVAFIKLNWFKNLFRACILLIETWVALSFMTNVSNLF